MSEDQEKQITETLELGLTVGCVIRDARKKTKKQTKTISNELKIAVKYLEGIENDDYSGFPGDAYMTGFVKNYANYLGLDGDELAKQLIKEQFGKKKAHVFNRMGQDIEPLNNKKVSLSERFIHQENGDFNNLGLVALAIVVFLIILVFSIFNKVDNAPEEIAPPAIEEKIEYGTFEDIIPEIVEEVEAEIVSDAIVEDAEEEVIDELEETPESRDFIMEEIIEMAPSVYGQSNINNSKVTLSVVDESWIEVFDKEKQEVLFTGNYNANDKIIIPDEDGIIMKTGNAGGVEVILDGKILPKLGEKGDVTDYISLSVKDLEDGYKPANKKKKRSWFN